MEVSLFGYLQLKLSLKDIILLLVVFGIKVMNYLIQNLIMLTMMKQTLQNILI